MSVTPDPEAVLLIVRDLDSDDPALRKAARDDLIGLHMPLVAHLARRFAGRGEPVEDLIQVGMVGLVKAVDRFDPARGVAFGSFAAPTVIGEIKRHFRDKGWAIRVPRNIQELRLALVPATEDLTHEFSRSPTIPELAHRLGVSEVEVLETIESSYAYRTESLDGMEQHDDESAQGPHETLGSLDSALEQVDNHESLRPLVSALSDREKAILEMRFFRSMTQSQIAAELGMSQMHVSRLLAQTLAQLREGLQAH